MLQGQETQPTISFKMVPALYSALDWKHDGKTEHSHRRKDGSVREITTMTFTSEESCSTTFAGFDLSKNYIRKLIHKNGNEAQEEQVQVIFIGFEAIMYKLIAILFCNTDCEACEN